MDGLKWVHQPFDAVVYLTLMAGLALVVSFFFRR